jgi:hypothetical protein
LVFRAEIFQVFEECVSLMVGDDDGQTGETVFAWIEADAFTTPVLVGPVDFWAFSNVCTELSF